MWEAQQQLVPLSQTETAEKTKWPKREFKVNWESLGTEELHKADTRFEGYIYKDCKV